MLKEPNQRFDARYRESFDARDSNNLGYILMVAIVLDEATFTQESQEQNFKQEMRAMDAVKFMPSYSRI